MKIVHCPTTVGGNPVGLSDAERHLGLDSRCVTIRQNYLNYAADEVILQDKDSGITGKIKIFAFAFKVLLKADVVHYNFGRSFSPTFINHKGFKGWLYNNLYVRFFQFWDLKLAHYLGRVTAMTYQGGDARQYDFCKEHYPIHFVHEDGFKDYSSSSDLIKQKRIECVSKYADLIYSVNPDLMYVLPERAKFIPYASVDPRKWQPDLSMDEPDIPHIVHAPSHRVVKGTQYVLDAVERLQQEKIPFKFTLVERLSHQEARALYETADILVDQLLAGFYGALSVEFMALGKPAICYMREEDMRYLPEDMRKEIPIISATPGNIYETLRDWLTIKKGDIRARGQLSRQYVERWHDPQKIAKTVIDDYYAARLARDD